MQKISETRAHYAMLQRRRVFILAGVALLALVGLMVAASDVTAETVVVHKVMPL